MSKAPIFNFSRDNHYSNNLMDAVRLKYREAQYHLELLRTLKKAEDFYATVNAFLSAGRSVLHVARHELGWQERRDDQRDGIGQIEETERKKFDDWYNVSQITKDILAHPLAKERGEVIHRKGQARFIHVPKPIGGMALEHGTPFRQALFNGPAGYLPLEDDNLLYYETAEGSRKEAVPYCQGYLKLIDQFIIELQKRPWASNPR